MMTISEAQRFEMHLALQRVLGDEVAGTLMDHLPPSGWSDLVRMRDVIELEKHLDGKIDNVETRLTSRIDNLEMRLDTKIENLEMRLNSRIDDLETRLNSRIDDLDLRLDKRIDDVNTRIDNLEIRMDTRFTILEERLKTIDGRMKVSLTLGLGIVLAMLAIQVQTLLTVASL